MLTIHGQHYPRADIDRLFFLRKDGGRGLMQIGAYIVEVIKLEEYVEHTQDPLVQIVRTLQHNTFNTVSNSHQVQQYLFRVTQSKQKTQ
jgi:hypothetical protein